MGGEGVVCNPTNPTLDLPLNIEQQCSESSFISLVIHFVIDHRNYKCPFDKKSCIIFIKQNYQMKQDISLITVIKLLLYNNKNKNKKSNLLIKFPCFIYLPIISAYVKYL